MNNLDVLIPQFCLNVVPWYYHNNTTAAKGTQKIREGDDICMPALWREKTLVAFSRQGYQAKTWALPPGRDGVRKCVVSEITVDGPKRLQQTGVKDGTVTGKSSPCSSGPISDQASASFKPFVSKWIAAGDARLSLRPPPDSRWPGRRAIKSGTSIKMTSNAACPTL